MTTTTALLYEYLRSQVSNPGKDEKVTSLLRRHLAENYGIVRGNDVKRPELEKLWWSRIITDNAGVPASRRLSDLLRQTVVVLGGTPTDFYNQNYYLLLELL